jgi:acetate---CoA ligase (ADP-forming)
MDPARPLDPASLDPLFRPSSVVIIGASADRNKIGGRPIDFLKRGGYRGAIYPINPRGGSIQGIPAYRSMAEIDGSIDHAIIAVGAASVPDALQECVTRGISAVQIFAAGFAELGDSGRKAQEDIAASARRAGVRVLGPNSLGMFSVHEGFFGTFSTALDGAWPKQGTVGIATQSGAFGSYAYGLAQARGLGFSSFVATGNEVDIDVAESVAWLAGDARTRTILVTIEGARDGRRLIDALALARAAGKSVVAMKVGTTEAGAEAASSHTGSLAGSDALYDAVFRRAGVHRAHSIEEMVDIAYACGSSRLPRGKRLGIVTTSGGVGVLLADAAVEHGLDLPMMSENVQQRVRDLVPFASGRNPIDTSAQILGDLGLFARMLEIAIEGGKLDSIICFLAHVGRNADHMAQLLPHLLALRQKYPDHTFALVLLCDATLTAQLEQAGFLVFEEPSRAVRALAAATRFGAPPAIRPEPAAAASIQQLSQVFSGRLNERDAKALLSGIGIPIAEDRVAATAEAARQAARAIGFPVVLKVLSADIPHKSDIGGVLLGLRSEDDVDSGFNLLVTRAAAAAPNARVEGVIVSPMISGVAETILGVRRDPVFGPIVMFGLGGIFVEVFKDVTFRPAPFGHTEAHEMIREIKAFKLLDGARGRPKADLDTLADVLVRLSEFAHANRDTLAEVDINPFVVLQKGGCALDALIVLVEASH